jgi:hypothetical protein
VLEVEEGGGGKWCVLGGVGCSSCGATGRAVTRPD